MKPGLPSACGAVLLLSALSVYGNITVSSWLPIYRGIDFATGTADAEEVRLQKVFTLRVDLNDPTIEFYSTPAMPNGTNETVGQVTTDFVETYGVAVGVNANFFAPVTNVANYPRNLRGLAISQGNLVSSFENSYPAVLITRSNQVSFASSSPASLTNVWTAVAGSDMILINGVAQLASCTTTFCLENPRTAVGLSQDGRYFYLMVVDGRQAGWSMGTTLYETGQWLARFGAWNGLNLDGGGSTALARLTNGRAVLLNQPSGGEERYDGNNLGVFAQPIQWAVWNGGGSNNRWSNAANWNGVLPVPGTNFDLQFAGSTRLSPTNDFTALSDFRHIAFNAGAGAFTLRGNSITLNGNLTNNSANLEAINLPLVVSATRTLAPISGDIALGGTISGAGGLTLVGPGTVTLTGNNTFAGATTVSGGTLAIAGSLTNSAGAVSVNGGTLAVNGTASTGTGTWSAGSSATRGVININTGATVQLNGSFTAGNVASGSGAVNINGGIVTNAQATGSGNLQIGAAGYGAFSMSGGKVFSHTAYFGFGAGTCVASLSDGALTVGAPGTTADYVLVGASTGIGVLTVSGGLLNHSNINRTISVNNSGDARGELNLLGGVIDNSGGGVSYGYNTGTGDGTGIVNLNRGNLLLNRFINKKQSGHSGTTGDTYLNFNGGTLTASPSTLTTPNLSFSSDFLPVLTAVYVNGPFGAFAGGAVIDTAGQNCIVDAALLAPTGSGVSGLAVADGGSGYIGAPYVSITGDGTGATAIANMIPDGSGALKVGSITVCNPGVNYTRAATSFSFIGGAPDTPATPGDLTVVGNTSGGLTKNGAGTLTLAGANTYTGPTRVNGGTLIVDGVVAAGSAVSVSGGALSGTGLIRGPVTVHVGGTLAPGGTSLGSLSVSNTLTLQAGSTAFIRVNAADGSCDLVRGITTASYGGTLVISNTAGTLAPGQSFQLFGARSYSQTFSNIQPAEGETTWSFNPATGTVSVMATTPTNLFCALSGETLTLTWPGSHLGWHLQSNAVSLLNPDTWYNIPGSQFATNLRITISPVSPPVFYRLRLP